MASTAGNHRTLTGFKAALTGGGARPNLFEVSILNWAGVNNRADVNSDKGYGTWTGDDKLEFQFMCKAAALPASTLGVVEIPFRGRVFKVTGDKVFDTWTVTVINDEDFSLRTRFEQWVNGMNKSSDGSGATNPASYMGDAIVNQLGRGYGYHGKANNPAESVKYSGPDYNAGTTKTMTPLRTYYLHDIWPSNVSAIDLSYDTTDTVEEFQVEFQVQYMTIGSAKKDGTGEYDAKGAGGRVM